MSPPSKCTPLSVSLTYLRRELADVLSAQVTIRSISICTEDFVELSGNSRNPDVIPMRGVVEGNKGFES